MTKGIWISKEEKAAADAKCPHENVQFLYAFKVYDPHLHIGECKGCWLRVCSPSQAKGSWRACSQQFRETSEVTG